LRAEKISFSAKISLGTQRSRIEALCALNSRIRIYPNESEEIPEAEIVEAGDDSPSELQE